MKFSRNFRHTIQKHDFIISVQNILIKMSKFQVQNDALSCPLLGVTKVSFLRFDMVSGPFGAVHFRVVSLYLDPFDLPTPRLSQKGPVNLKTT